MTHKNRLLVALLATAFSATLATPVLAAPGDRVPDDTPRVLSDEAKTLDGLAAGNQSAGQKIAKDFSALAGSDAKATALVNSLRTGETIQLAGTSSTDTAVAFDPPTGKMGWGNVFISLALAQESLSSAGITNPTATQLAAALNGGTVTLPPATPGGTPTTVTFAGVLTQRASGMGWGQIANAMGVKLGRVISAIKSENKSLAASAEHGKGKGHDVALGATTKKLDKREHAAEFTGHGERGDRPDRPDRPQRPEMADRGSGRAR